jgi:inorganic pyrophosphatase
LLPSRVKALKPALSRNGTGAGAMAADGNFRNGPVTNNVPAYPRARGSLSRFPKGRRFPKGASRDGSARTATGPDRPIPHPTFASNKANCMNIDLIPTGKNPPDNLNVIIEVPLGGEPVKYEFDKSSGALFVDRILHTPMRYPANYGFIPHTLSPDGDPLDALVISRTPFIPGAVVRARPIAVLFLEDEAGGDEKLITVPVDETFPYYTGVGQREDLPEIVLQQIEHFFTHYKDLEPEKWVRISHWGNADEARRVVVEAIASGRK